MIPAVAAPVVFPWRLSWRADPRGRVIADRHYNRQAPGAPQFVPPGQCIVLAADGALWVSSWPKARYVRHAWPGAWVCSAFRNERRDLYLSSALITAAVAATRWYWPQVPALGMVTFITRGKPGASATPAGASAARDSATPEPPKAG